jgi:hypothetical protein
MDADVETLVDGLLAGPFTHSLAKLYIRERPLNAAGVPDHELGAGVDAERGVGGLRYTSAFHDLDVIRLM